MARVRGRLRQLHARLVPGCVILLYHRVAATPADPYQLCVDPLRFEQHLQVIREVARPLPLEEVALAALTRQRLPERGVCITFDDGYQDNLYTALPLLQRYEIPATMFMTTGSIGRRREFWWDELQRIFLEPEPLPARLQLRVAGQLIDTDLASSASYTAADVERDRSWTIFAAATPTPRHAAFQTIYRMMRLMSAAEQIDVLDRLLEWAGRATTVRPTHRALEADEVVAVQDSGLVEVAGHTINHPALHAQPVAVQREEIAGCKATLEQWLGRRVRSFAYPYGSFSDDSVAEVKRAGFDYACACMGRPVRRSNPFLLPRIDATDVDGEALARELTAHFGR